MIIYFSLVTKKKFLIIVIISPDNIVFECFCGLGFAVDFMEENINKLLVMSHLIERKDIHAGVSSHKQHGMPL